MIRCIHHGFCHSCPGDETGRLWLAAQAATGGAIWTFALYWAGGCPPEALLGEVSHAHRPVCSASAMAGHDKALHFVDWVDELQGAVAISGEMIRYGCFVVTWSAI